MEDQLRDLAPRVLATLIRRYGDFDAAEDAVQEALVAAAASWPARGVPEKPQGWLVQSATRRMIDHWRSDRSRRAREALAVGRDAPHTVAVEEDDTLKLFFMCCHPALPPASAIPLTLRAVGGLTTAEIARAFMVSEATMAQRISRAKQRIRSAGATFSMPSDGDVGRLRSVLHVLYLIFNEGYTSSAGEALLRVELADEAIRLARMVRRMTPHDGEVAGLLALMLLTDARRAARISTEGDLVPLPEQDRGLWDQASIAEGVALLNEALATPNPGQYQIQAAIAALHDEAPTADATDWPQILGLYDVLERLTGNPVVSLNRAVAVAMVHGPEAGLRTLDSLDVRIGQSSRVDAVRAHLHEMAGDTAAAIACYAAAARQATNLAERHYLTARAAHLKHGVPP